MQSTYCHGAAPLRQAIGRGQFESELQNTRWSVQNAMLTRRVHVPKQAVNDVSSTLLTAFNVAAVVSASRHVNCPSIRNQALEWSFFAIFGERDWDELAESPNCAGPEHEFHEYSADR